MKNSIFILTSMFLWIAGCAPHASEDKLYHQSDLHQDLWQEDSTAVEQVFVINTDTITTLVCEQGTKLIIPPGAFILEDTPEQPIQGRVTLRIREVYQSGNMFRDHLTTQEEEGKLLASAGMLYLSAYADGQRLQLKEGKEILLGFPRKEGFKEARLFSGVETAAGVTRWKQEESSFDLKQAIKNTYFKGDNSISFRVILPGEGEASGEGEATNKQSEGTYERDSDGRQVEYAEPANNADTMDAIDRVAYPVILVKDENITASLSLATDYDEYYFFRTTQLEWINCDRFVEEEVTDLQLNITGYPVNTLYYLVFEEINALMSGYRNAGESEEKNSVFEQVPVGHQATLIVVYSKGGDYFLAHQDIIIGPEQAEQSLQLAPKKMKKASITHYLQGLGKAETLSASN